MQFTLTRLVTSSRDRPQWRNEGAGESGRPRAQPKEGV